VTVGDKRTTDFWFVTKKATAAIRAEFAKSAHRSEALAIYGALAELASDERAKRKTDVGFEATQDAVAELAGVGRATLKLVIPRMVKADVLEVLGGRGKTSCWTLVDPDDTPPAAVDAEVEPVEVGRDTANQLAVTRPTPYTGGEEAYEEKEQQKQPALPSLSAEVAGSERERVAIEICDRIGENVLRLSPNGKLPAGAPRSADWVSAATALLDDHDADQVLAVVDWVCSDDWWRTRVLTPGFLKANYDSAYAKSLAGRSSNRSSLRRDMDRRENVKRRRTANAGSCCLQPGAAPAAVEDELRQIFAGIAADMSPTTYDIWIQPGHAHIGADGELLVAYSEVTLGWVTDRHQPRFDRAAGRHIELVYCEESTP
jgi:hypothetical protein